jgi:Ulp1 family protease
LNDEKWLNSEIINLYLSLFEERQTRHPDKFEEAGTPSLSIEKTPEQRMGKRRNTFNRNYISTPINFEEHKFLAPNKSDDIYQLLKGN